MDDTPGAFGIPDDPVYQNTGAEAMEPRIKTKLIENMNDEKVTAEVEIIADLPEMFDVDDQIQLKINGHAVGIFANSNGIQKAIFQPQEFGQIPCQVVFLDGDDVAETWDEMLEINIQTFFVGAHADVGHPMRNIRQDGVINLFSQERARGNNDICFRIIARVPTEKKIEISSIVSKLNDKRARYNCELEVHYRLADYKDRNDLYVAPDEAMYHIDKQLNHWIQDEPIVLEHGIHVLYVCPSVMHDLSFLTVHGFGDFVFTVSGYFKTIDYEGLGLLP
jgi:hypothetical protein